MKSATRAIPPEISVIIPCFNLGQYLDGAVNSVCAQTFQDFEIIIVNPSSTDKYTKNLLANYKRPKTRVVHTPFMSLSESRNKGIEATASPYICCLDSDDILEPTCFEKCAKVLDRDDDVGFVTFWYRYFGEEEGEVKPTSVELKDFLIQNSACVASLFRREAWQKAGGYDKSFTRGYEDWDFWITILEAGYKAFLLKEFLFRYRVRPDSLVIKSNLPENRIVIMQQMIDKHRKVLQQHIADVLQGREKQIGELLHWARQQDNTKRWLLQRDTEHEKHIEELKGAIAWHVKQLENHRAEISHLRDETNRHLECITRQEKQITHQGEEIGRQKQLIDLKDEEIRRQKQLIDLKDHELRSVYLSKEWKLGCAFKDARHSLKGAALLPFRLLDLGCPRSMKRLIRKAMMIQPHEMIRKNFYKFPYRLADRVLPESVREACPLWLRNAMRSLFRTTDERLYRQKRWNGPLVSVIIPCYNYGRFVEEALQSVLGQTYQNSEIIIVDDGSSDSFTKDKLTEIESRRIPRLRMLHQTNQGVSRARNNGIMLAQGKYICCLDADDTLEPSYLEKCLIHLESKNLDVCYSFFVVMGNGNWISRTGNFDIETLKLRNCACGAAVFKKSFWKKSGGYNPNMHVGYEDWDFWISLAERGARGVVIPEPLFKYRRHGRTKNEDAEMHHNLLYAQIKNNHPRLYQKNEYAQKNVTYQVLNPFINIPCPLSQHHMEKESFRCTK